jgi:aquaporin rerated protein, invertebrate
MASLSDLLISSAFIVLCCALAQVARKVLDRFSSIHGLVKELILEAIAAAELCSTCFELIIGKREQETFHFYRLTRCVLLCSC